MPPAWIITIGDTPHYVSNLSTMIQYYNTMHTDRNNLLFWTDVFNDSVFIWQSNLDDGSEAIPLINTDASLTQYGKHIIEENELTDQGKY